MGIPNKYSDLQDFVLEFEALGYSRWLQYESLTSGDIWYRFGSLSADTFHVAYLRFQPRGRSYAITLGGFNQEQLKILESMKIIISKYMFDVAHTGRFSFSSLIIGSLYIPARGKYLNLLSIPNRLNREEWRSQLNTVKHEFLEKIFWRIDGPDKLMDILLRDYFPFEWVVTPPVFRAAEVVALSHVLGWSTAQIKKELACFKSLLEKRMTLANDFDVMIDEFIRDSCPH